MIGLIIVRTNPADWPKKYSMRRVTGTPRSASTLTEQQLRDYLRVNDGYVCVARPKNMPDDFEGVWEEDDTASDGDDAEILQRIKESCKHPMSSYELIDLKDVTLKSGKHIKAEVKGEHITPAAWREGTIVLDGTLPYQKRAIVVRRYIEVDRWVEIDPATDMWHKEFPEQEKKKVMVGLLVTRKNLVEMPRRYTVERISGSAATTYITATLQPYLESNKFKRVARPKNGHDDGLVGIWEAEDATATFNDAEMLGLLKAGSMGFSNFVLIETDIDPVFKTEYLATFQDDPEFAEKPEEEYHEPTSVIIAEQEDQSPKL